MFDGIIGAPSEEPPLLKAEQLRKVEKIIYDFLIVINP
jgi:hypothetical protein